MRGHRPSSYSKQVGDNITDDSELSCPTEYWSLWLKVIERGYVCRKTMYFCLSHFPHFPSTVLKWLIASAGRSFSTAVSEQLRLLPLLFKVKPLALPLTNFHFLPLMYAQSKLMLAHPLTVCQLNCLRLLRLKMTTATMS